MTNKEIELLIKRDLNVDAEVKENVITVIYSNGTTRHLVMTLVGTEVLYFIATSYGRTEEKAAYPVNSYSEGRLHLIQNI